MKKTLILSILTILTAQGWGHIAAEPGAEEATSEASQAAVAELKPPPGVQPKYILPPEEGCNADDEYYYETTSYSSVQTYLWHCVGYDSFNQYTECDTYKVCQVKKIYAHAGICDDGTLYTYTYLKSSTVTNNCYNVSYATTGGMCPPVLFGGFCY